MSNYMTEFSPNNDTNVYQVKDKESAPITLLKDTVGWTGKNIADTSKTEIGTAWNGNANADRARLIIPCKESTTYIISIDSSLGGITYIGCSNSASIPPSGINEMTNNMPYYLNTNAGDKYITIGFSKTSIAQSDIDAIKLMVREASILDSTYEPYHPSVKETLRDGEVIEGKIQPSDFEQGAINAPNQTNITYAALKTSSTTRIRTQNIVPVPSGKWQISVDFTTYEVNSMAFDNDGKAIYPVPAPYNNWSSSPIDIDTTGTVKGVALAIRRKDGANITTSELSNINPLIYSLPLKDSKFDRAEQRVLGAKNLCESKCPTSTINGITYTKNADGSYTISGVNDGTNPSTIRIDQSSPTGTDNLKSYSGRFTMSLLDANKNYVPNTTMIMMQNSTWSTLMSCDSSNSGIQTAEVNASNLFIYITVPKNADFSTPKTVYPMLRLASDPDNTYVPYAMTNRELTEELTVQESAITTSYTIGDIGNHIVKYGKVVQLSVKISGVTANAWDQIGTIPQGYRPIYTTRFRDGTVSNKLISVANDGKIYAVENVSNLDLALFATWITS